MRTRGKEIRPSERPRENKASEGEPHGQEAVPAEDVQVVQVAQAALVVLKGPIPVVHHSSRAGIQQVLDRTHMDQMLARQHRVDFQRLQHNSPTEARWRLRTERFVQHRTGN